jgi:hypothetical protein
MKKSSTRQRKKAKECCREKSAARARGQRRTGHKNDGKPSFASRIGNIATGKRDATNGALIASLRMDPQERGAVEGGEAMKFMAQQMRLRVPVQGKIQ